MSGYLGCYLSSRFAKLPYVSVIGIDIQPYYKLPDDLKDSLHNYYEFDLKNTSQIPELIDRIKKEIGIPDIFINNAGLKTFSSLEDLGINVIEDTMRINYLAPVIFTKSLIRYMNDKGEGIIINISSNAAFQGYKYGSIYCSTKSALNLFAESVNDELSSTGNVRIFNICPSTIYTKEIEAANPGVNPEKYISRQRVFAEILNIIKNKPSYSIIPVISKRQKLKYIFYDIKKHIRWARTSI